MSRSLINNFITKKLKTLKTPLIRNFSVVNNINRYEKLLFNHYEKVILNKSYNKNNKNNCEKCQITNFYKFINKEKIIIFYNIKKTF